MMAAESPVDEFVAELEKQEGIYRQMLEVARKQLEMGALQGVEALDTLISEKATLLGEIEAIEQRIADKKRRWLELKGTLSEEERTRVGECLDRMAETLRTLIEIEDKNRGLLSHSRDLVAGDLKHVADGKKLQGTYGPLKSEDSRFIDTKE